MSEGPHADGPGDRGEGRVTRLEPQKRATDRTNVYLDGRFAFGVSNEALAGAGVREGDYLSAEQQARLEALDEVQTARARALGFLSVRERSRREVTDRLRRYGYPEETAEGVLAWLEGLGYVDDRRFGELFAREKLAGGWGPRRVREELWRRGVARPIVDEVLQDLAPDDGAEAAQREDALVETVRRRFAREYGRDPERARRRAQGYLLRRGHEFETVSRVLRRSFDEGE